MEQENSPQTFRWYIFHNDQLLLQPTSDELYGVPKGVFPPLPAEGTPVLDVMSQDGMPIKAMQVTIPSAYAQVGVWTGLRASYDVLPLEEYLQAGKAYQMLYWDSHSRYCPACGTPTLPSAPNMKRCPACGYEVYPRISTAIIVLIKRGADEVLLVHARNFKGSFKGLVAGFLEAGETLEQCVEREVMEETGLTIKNIRYIASQPWPYPSGLMVGFTAEYASGSIKLQEEELSTAAFYHRDHLPEIPKKLSIARQLIDAWLERKI